MSQKPQYPAADLSLQIKQIGYELGFQGIGITSTELDSQHQNFRQWLQQHYHGEMAYMERNIDKRLDPKKLTAGTLSVICVRMNYLTEASENSIRLLDHASRAYISRYALGRDYHKLMRKRLQKFADTLTGLIGEFGYRVFTDSAPVLEKALSVKAGLGWQGKHSNLLHRQHGSWFFLGEIYTDLPLQADQAISDHCGECTACMDKCPTQAIVKPYVVDARRCISYLTIEHNSAIPVEFRKAIGNRIYGCDDCQLYCPWNRFEKFTQEVDFNSRHGLSDIELLDCFKWSEQQFLDRFAGSPIRRIGFEKWRRNIAVALGNAAYSPYIVEALQTTLTTASSLLAEHVNWAITQQLVQQPGKSKESPMKKWFDFLSTLSPQPLQHDNVICSLNDTGLLYVGGDDAMDFLQNQLSNNINDINTGLAQLSSLSNAKGRLTGIFRVVKIDGGYLLILPRSILVDIQQQLQKFIIMSKVVLADISDSFASISITCDDEIINHDEFLEKLFYPAETNRVYQSDSLISIHIPSVSERNRYILLTNKAEEAMGLWNGLSTKLTVNDQAHWRLQDIEAGIPTIYPDTAGAFVLQMSNLDLVDGVSFKKGCFPGQEVVARMQYLGKLKRRMFLVEVNTSDCPKPGDELSSRGADKSDGSGRVVDAVAISPERCLMLFIAQINKTEANELVLLKQPESLINRKPLPYSFPQ